MSPMFLAPLALALPLGPVQQVAFEDFDAPGSSWAQTIFPDVHAAASNGLSREFLTVDQGAPVTFPPLPIAAGGDLEGRVFEAMVPGGNPFALMANTPENVFRDGGIRAVVGFGVPDSFGSQEANVLLRARVGAGPGPGSHLFAYSAGIVRQGSVGIFVLARWNDGVITSAFAESKFSMGNPMLENFLIQLRAVGTRLDASLWRITAGAGRIVLTPVVLGGGLGPFSNQLAATDDTLASGRAGLHAFVRATNSVFFDDVLVKAYDTRRLTGSVGRSWAPPSWSSSAPTWASRGAFWRQALDEALHPGTGAE